MGEKAPIDHKLESLPSKEKRWDVSFSVVTISGKPGCGNTVLANSLAEKYGVKLVTIGQLLKKRI